MGKLPFIVFIAWVVLNSVACTPIGAKIDNSDLSAGKFVGEDVGIQPSGMRGCNGGPGPAGPPGPPGQPGPPPTAAATTAASG